MYWMMFGFYLLMIPATVAAGFKKTYKPISMIILFLGVLSMSILVTDTWRDCIFVFLTGLLLYLTMLFFTREHNGANICIVLALSMMTSVMFFTISRHSLQPTHMTGLYVLVPVVVFGPRRSLKKQDVKVLLILLPLLLLSFTFSRFEIHAELETKPMVVSRDFLLSHYKADSWEISTVSGLRDQAILVKAKIEDVAWELTYFNDQIIEVRMIKPEERITKIFKGYTDSWEISVYLEGSRAIVGNLSERLTTHKQGKVTIELVYLGDGRSDGHVVLSLDQIRFESPVSGNFLSMVKDFEDTLPYEFQSYLDVVIAWDQTLEIGKLILQE